MSRNGTWLNGKKLKPNALIPLAKGDTVYFAKLLHTKLTMIDAEPPVPILFPRDQPSSYIKLEKYNLLPNDDYPEYVIFQNPENQQWYFQDIKAGDTEEKAAINENTDLYLDNKHWQIFIPPELTGTKKITADIINIDAFEITFDVSLNEEHIDIHFSNDNANHSFGTKTCNYLLYYLAAKRIDDHEKGISALDQGWVSMDVLIHELKNDETYINVLIYRLRRMANTTLQNINNASNLIERRRGQIRISTKANKITINKSKIKKPPTLTIKSVC